MNSGKRLLLIDPSAARTEILARRLLAQGYRIDQTNDAAAGADLALSSPPDAVVADLWMPGISGVQLCRLLKSEPATADVPIVLCGEQDEPRNRFWAGRAGAAAYVVKGRTGELVRALSSALADAAPQEPFFVQLSGGGVDIRERLARHLDAALFESVIAAELRSLASAASFDRLFDLLAQLMSQVLRYRWIALETASPSRIAVHHHPARRSAVDEELSACFGGPPSLRVEDEDAANGEADSEPLVCPVVFGHATVGRFALSPGGEQTQDASVLVTLVGRELGGALKIATLVEESQRLAATDPLTGLMNRRALGMALAAEVSRTARHGYSLTLLLLDVDHFKRINDLFGHNAGDHVLAELAKCLRQELRGSDLAGRWGGEEFVVAYTSTDLAGAQVAAERLRQGIESYSIATVEGTPIPVTASIGLAGWRPGESLDNLVARADRAMYASKTAGRNRITASLEDAHERFEQGLH